MVSEHNLMDEGQKRTGVQKLLRQLGIQETRVETAHERLVEMFPNGDFHLRDELVLDAETYYTIAHDLLTLAAGLMDASEKRRFRQEPAVKMIRTIRNHLVRHAFGGHRDNDPHCGYAWGSKDGIILKGGSLLGQRDAGFFSNRDQLRALLKRYGITKIPMATAPGTPS